MWEFSVSLNSAHCQVAEFLYNSLKKYVGEVDGIITSYDEAGLVTIVIACSEAEKARLSYYVSACITDAICTYFKKEFLKKHLNVQLKNKISLVAFEKALLYFDKETDRYLVNKYLVLEKNLYLESFFEFKLKVLKNKWMELTKIANENSAYLLTDDTFVELLKFLIDNLEISHDEINVILENNAYHLLDENFKELDLDKNASDGSWLVGNIIALSPRKINVYSDEENYELNLIGSVFEDRINFLPKQNVKMVDKRF